MARREGQHSQMPRPFYRHRQGALVTGAGARPAARLNLAPI